MKTALEWFQTLPEAICAMAIENARIASEEEGINWLTKYRCSLADALICSFAFSDTPEGWEFWDRIVQGGPPLTVKEKNNKGFGTYCRRFKTWNNK